MNTVAQPNAVMVEQATQAAKAAKAAKADEVHAYARSA
jgi:hypothetical protein